MMDNVGFRIGSLDVRAPLAVIVALILLALVLSVVIVVVRRRRANNMQRQFAAFAPGVRSVQGSIHPKDERL